MYSYGRRLDFWIMYVPSGDELGSWVSCRITLNREFSFDQVVTRIILTNLKNTLAFISE
jgi:hypothetical protein